MTKNTTNDSHTSLPDKLTNRILLGIDAYSELDGPIHQAIAFATCFEGTELDIAWVPPVRVMPTATAAPHVLPDPQIVLRERLERYFEENDTEVVRDAKTRIQLLLGYGDPAQELSKIAFMRDSKMIVVGAHEKQGAVLDFLMGSVAKKLVEEAPCPVLVVRPNLSEAVPELDAPIQDGQAPRSLGKQHRYSGTTRNQRSGENMPLLFPMNP